MENIKFNIEAAKTYRPFLEEILEKYPDDLHSVTVFGSALTEDFDPARSDINSVIVLNRMDLGFLKIVAPMGKKYRGKKVAAPLIMTPAYIENSLDVFPIEFLNLKLLHHTLHGEDIFENLQVTPSDLRLQCERELKARLIGLRQGYIASLNDRKTLMDMFSRTISGYIPIFRAIVFLFEKTPPANNRDVLAVFGTVSGIDTAVFGTLLAYKKTTPKLSREQIDELFDAYYAATEKTGELVDAIHG